MLAQPSFVLMVPGFKKADLGRILDPSCPRNVSNALDGTKTSTKTRETFAANANAWAAELRGDDSDDLDSDFPFSADYFDFSGDELPWRGGIEKAAEVNPWMKEAVTPQRIIEHEAYWHNCFRLYREGRREFPAPPFPNEIIKPGFWDDLESYTAQKDKRSIPLIVIETILDEFIYFLSLAEYEYNVLVGVDRCRGRELTPAMRGKHWINPMRSWIVSLKRFLGVNSDNELAVLINNIAYDGIEEPPTSEMIRKWCQGSRFPDDKNYNALKALVLNHDPDLDYEFDFIVTYRYAILFQKVFNRCKKSNFSTDSIELVFSRYERWFHWHEKEGSEA